MSAPGKGTALADVAALASNQGTGEARLRSETGEIDQGDLLGLRELDDELALFDDQALKPPKRRAGRPPGSVNRSTMQLKKLLAARGYRDPAEFLAAILSMDLKDLTALLGGDPAEAIKAQVKAAAELMPYFHQKAPVAVHHTGEASRPLIVVMDGPGGARSIGGADGAMSIHDVINQQVIETGGARSHGAGSHETGQADDDAR